MEITSFILGVCAVILLLMIVGTSVNYMAIKAIREGFEKYVNRSDSAHSYQRDVNGKEHEELHSRITELEQALVRHTDSRVDKLDNKLNRLDDKLMNEVKLLLQKTDALNQEISRVEKGYKEKINY